MTIKIKWESRKINASTNMCTVTDWLGAPSHTFIFLACLLCSLDPYPITASEIDSEHYIEISKSARRLLVIGSSNETLREYSIAVGRGGPGDKHRLGDQKTPIGVYEVAGFKSDSDFYYFIRLNYPNENDARKGFRSKLITKEKYNTILSALSRRETPPQNTALGGAIGIHGIGEESQEKIEMHGTLDWTQGCIALRNHEIDDLLSFLSVGIRVVIKD